MLPPPASPVPSAPPTVARTPSPPAHDPKPASPVKLTLDDKIRLFVENCQEKKPPHRSKLPLTHPRSGESVLFMPGKFLNNLTDALLSEKTRGLDEEHLEALQELHWFDDWLVNLRKLRMVGKSGGAPTLAEETRLLAAHCADKLPERGSVLEVKRDNGEKHLLNVHDVIEKIAINWHQESLEEFESRVLAWKNKGAVGTMPRRRTASKPRLIDNASMAAIERCAWFSAWHENAISRREVARLRKVVSKQTKIDTLCKNYAGKCKPMTSDCLNIEIDNEDVFLFYPITFLDDISDNWIRGGSRPNVVLDEAQKGQFERLPWFAQWLKSVEESRLRRRKRLRDETEAVAEAVADAVAE